MKIGFDVFPHGIIKRRLLEGATEDEDDWRVGHPILFPNILLVGDAVSCTMQFRVPADDTTTYHVSLYTYRAAPGYEAAKQEVIPYRIVPLTNERGEYIVDLTFNQDYMAWITQGPIAMRDLEKLGESDKGIILFRKLLREQLDILADGGEPMNVFRDPMDNERISLPLENGNLSNAKQLEYRPGEAGVLQATNEIQSTMATWAKFMEESGRDPAMQPQEVLDVSARPRQRACDHTCDDQSETHRGTGDGHDGIGSPTRPYQ